MENANEYHFKIDLLSSEVLYMKKKIQMLFGRYPDLVPSDHYEITINHHDCEAINEYWSVGMWLPF